MDTKRLNWMADETRVGRMSRREFGGRAAVLGLSATGASTLLASKGVAAEPVKGGTVSVATIYSGPEETLDTTRVTNATDNQRCHQVYDRVTDLDRDLNVIPSLATEWASANGATEWSFKLRQGVEFHDGKTLTPEDVIYSFQVHIKEGSTSPAKPIFSTIKEMKADGPDVVKFTLSAGDADFPVSMAYTLGASVIPDGWVDGNEINGTGPYRLAEFNPGLESVTTKFANYWDSSVGHVETFITRGIPDNTARSNALRLGEIDLCPNLEAKVANLMASDPKLNIVSTPSGSWFGWVMMCDRQPTNDINVRLALKHAVNRQYLVDNVSMGYGKVANDFPVNPALPTYCSDVPQHEYDPEKAKYYWDKAGIASIDLHVSNAAHPSAVDCSTIFQEQARAAGITINLVRAPDDGYWDNVWMKVPLAVTGWNSRPTADLIMTMAHLCGGSWNETAWCNERFDQLLAMGRIETDPALRKEIYCEASTLLHDEGGILIPFFTSYVEGVRSRIQDYHGSPANAMGAGWPYKEIWIDESKA